MMGPIARWKRIVIGGAFFILAMLSFGAAVAVLRDPYCNALGFGFWDCLRFAVNARAR